jgi:ATP-dependent helicase/nuclease subunit B
MADGRFSAASKIFDPSQRYVNLGGRFFMETILGPFHPYLENALVGEIRRHKKADPFCPLLVLVPSGSLRRRLKVLLVGEHRLNLLNLQILTFHQFSLRLIEEQRGVDNLELRDDSFLEEVLRQIIRTGRQVPSVFSGIDERVGGCAALWQTLRDLKDGMVEPSLALEALREGHFGRDLSDRMSNLLAIFQTLLSFCKERKIQDYSDLDRLAAEWVSSSSYLQRFVRIFYYGFYDLTQLQVDLFHAVAQSRPTTLFFPLYHATPSHPGWIFAERFYSRYVRGQIGSVENLVAADANLEKGGLAYRLFDDAWLLTKRWPSTKSAWSPGASTATAQRSRKFLQFTGYL